MIFKGNKKICELYNGDKRITKIYNKGDLFWGKPRIIEEGKNLPIYYEHLVPFDSGENLYWSFSVMIPDMDDFIKYFEYAFINVVGGIEIKIPSCVLESVKGNTITLKILDAGYSLNRKLPLFFKGGRKRMPAQIYNEKLWKSKE